MRVGASAAASMPRSFALYVNPRDSGPPRLASSGRTGGHLSYVSPSTFLRVPVVVPVRQCVRPSRLFAARTFARVRALTREYAGEAAREYPRTVASTLRGQVPRSTAEARSASTRNARVRAHTREYAGARGYARSSGSTRIARRVARRDMNEGRPRGWSVLSAGAGGM